MTHTQTTMQASMRLSACITASLLACGITTHSKAAPIEIQYNNRSTNQKETIFIDFVTDSWNNIESTIRAQPWWNNVTLLDPANGGLNGYTGNDGILNGTIIDDGQNGTFNQQKFSESDTSSYKTFGYEYYSFNSSNGLVERIFGKQINRNSFGIWRINGTDDRIYSNRNWAIAGNLIKPGGNIVSGTGINNTSNLSPNGNLFPIFQGGTLTVDQDNQTYTQNFTLNRSVDNAINNNGYSVKFSGIFSDAPGESGMITFRPNANFIEISGKNTYTGSTVVNGNGTLRSRNGAIPDSSDVFLSPYSQLAILGDEIIASLRSTQRTATVDLEGNNLSLGSASPIPARFFGSIQDSSGQGKVIKIGSNLQTLTGTNTYTGATIVRGGRLSVMGSITSETTVETGGTLQGSGTIFGNVINEGNVSPGNSIGTLTVDGNYVQGPTNPNANLNIEVNGSSSDLLKITGDNRVVLLGGNLKISSIPGTHVTPGVTYTAIDVTGQGGTGGELNLQTDLSGVVGSSAYLFARETNPAFARIDQSYYDTCTSPDPNIQKNCTKLQFAWLQVAKNPDPSKGTKQVATPTGSVAVVAPSSNQSPSQTINQVKQTGGAITTASSGNSNTNINTCTANTGNAASCQQQNKSGSGNKGSNANNIEVAKVIDAGQASLGVVVTNGTTGGDPVTVNGVNSGYTTNQTKQAKVTPDFVSVYNALFSIPTRQDLNQALHSISAEPYASMQSVALEAIEQFGKNSLALTDRAVPITHTQTFCKTDDGNLIPADSPQRPETCNERKQTVGSRWSLLLDGTNTEANLDGTSDLASLDYNVFSTIYGLQYAFSPEWSAGGAFSYGQANLYNYEYANSRINSDTYGGSVWGIYRPTADWKFSGLLGFMNLQYDSTRQMTFGGLNRTAEADWEGNGFTAALEAQYNWALNGDSTDPNAIRIKPRTFLSYAVHNQGSFSESGAQSLNLAVDSHTADSLLWGIGFTLETPIRLNDSNRIIPRFTVGYDYDFMGDANEEHELSASFSELPALGSKNVLGQNRGANALDLGLSIEIETADSVSIYGGVNGGFWSNGTEISYGGGLKYSW